jgi:hypothetical protein
MCEPPLKDPASHGWLWRSDIKQPNARVYEMPDGTLVSIPDTVPHNYIVIHGKALVAKAIEQNIVSVVPPQK